MTLSRNPKGLDACFRSSDTGRCSGSYISWMECSPAEHELRLQLGSLVDRRTHFVAQSSRWQRAIPASYIVWGRFVVKNIGPKHLLSFCEIIASGTLESLVLIMRGGRSNFYPWAILRRLCHLIDRCRLHIGQRIHSLSKRLCIETN